jgi:hypothetical protein
MPHEPFMMPKMGKVLTLSADGKTVTVVGPINWNVNPFVPPASLSGSTAAPLVIPQEIAVVFTVVVSQVKPGGAGVAVAIGWSTEIYTKEANWDADANVVGTTGAFTPGGATAAAWASIAHDDGGYASYEWTLPVELKKA